MHLWTEYEGNTLAGYPLGRLTRSEGRSAFFLTNTPEGLPATLRLTEAHYDEGELTGRWRKAAAVQHPHLQPILHFGQTTFDGVPLACCLLEQTDASLSDVLRERTLTTAETLEVAEAVSSAMAALHAAGLMHEHVDATNVFAVGETVKLRSDCVRECHGDFEADTEEAREELRKRDVRDLGLLLLRCLTLDWQGSTTDRLPAPFDKIVPNALDGKWTAAAIAAEIESRKPAPIRVVEPVATPATAGVASAAGATATPAATTAARTAVTPGPVTVPGSAGISASTYRQPARPAAAAAAQGAPRYSGMPPAGSSVAVAEEVQSDPFDTGLGRLRRESVPVEHGGDRVREALRTFQQNLPVRVRMGRGAAIAGVAAAGLLGVVLWNVSGSKPASHPEQAAAVPAAPVQHVVPAPAAAAPARTANPATARDRAETLFSAIRSEPGWHVIAYTYNYEQQAQAKVSDLQKRYFALKPQVYSPTGHAPYFVALGNNLDQNSATALRNQARRAGLPRDTYVRAFKGSKS